MNDRDRALGRIEFLSEPTAPGAQWARARVPGWDSHVCEVLVAHIDGEPRVIGLRLLPRLEDAPRGMTVGDAIITRARLAAFPVQTYARVVASVMAGGTRRVVRALDALAAADMGVKEDPRQKATPEQVAALYLKAKDAGLPPRKAVTDGLHISDRTADRYIRQAREAGLIPPHAEQRRTKVRDRQQGEGSGEGSTTQGR